MNDSSASVTVLECLAADRDRFLAGHLGTAEPGTVVLVTDTGQEYVRTQQYAWATVTRREVRRWQNGELDGGSR